METLEKNLRSIIENNTPKSITYDGMKVYISKNKIKEINKFLDSPEMVDSKKGGILPLVALLPLIFGGITAAGATAASIANVVKTSREAALIGEKKKVLTEEKKENGAGYEEDENKPTRAIAKAMTESKLGQKQKLEKDQSKSITKYFRGITTGEGLKKKIKKLGENDLQYQIVGKGIYISPINYKGEGIFLNKAKGEGIFLSKADPDKIIS